MENYEFTVDWFSAYAHNWDSLVNFIAPRRILEVGSYEGRSACYLVDKLLPLYDFELHCIDTWKGGGEHKTVDMNEVESRFDNNIEKAYSKYGNNLTLFKHKGDSADELCLLVAQGYGCGFDLIYIDGSHQAADVIVDAVLAFKLLRVGGLMIFDDYYWNPSDLSSTDILNQPKLAIDSFVNLYSRKCQVIVQYSGYQLYIAKISE